MKQLLLLLGILAVPTAFAAPTAPKLGAPLMTKLDWGTRSLTVADIDGDGRLDLAVLNNDTGRVELLYQRKPGEPVSTKHSLRRDRWTPDLDDALFRRDSVPGNASMRALAVGDLNGDGLADIAFTSERGGLTVILQGPKKGEWREPISDKTYETTRDADTLRILRDGNNPKSPAMLVQLVKDGIALWKFEQTAATATPRLPVPRLLRTNGTNGNLFAQHVGTGDNARLLLGTQTGSMLRFREQYKDGTFGPEISLNLKNDIANLERALPNGAFVTRDTSRPGFGEMRFANDDQPLAGATSASPRVYSFAAPIATASQAAILDTNGDGRGDLVVADPKGAKLFVWRGKTNGDFAEPVEYPSLSGISELAVVEYGEPNQPPKKALFVLSEKENVLGCVTFTDGKPSFPVPIKVDGKTLLLATDGGLAIALVKDKNGKTSFQRIRYNAAQKGAADEWKVETLAPVDIPRRDIAALKIADLNNDGRPDLLAFIDREPARIWLQDGNGVFTEAAKDSSYRKSMLDGAMPADIAVVNAAKCAAKNAAAAANDNILLVASQGFVRALRFDAKGEISVVFQANSRKPGDRLRAPQFIEKSLVARNENGDLEWFERDAGGVFRSVRQIEADLPVPLEACLQTVAGEKTPRLLYLADKSLVQLPTARRGMRGEVRKLFESNLENFRTTIALPARFDGKPPAKNVAANAPNSVVLIDSVHHTMEIARRLPNGTWASVLHFLLFDENAHYNGRRSSEQQPREALVADLTGDGLEDIVLLLHDRILVYPQKK